MKKNSKYEKIEILNQMLSDINNSSFIKEDSFITKKIFCERFQNSDISQFQYQLELLLNKLNRLEIKFYEFEFFSKNDRFNNYKSDAETKTSHIDSRYDDYKPLIKKFGFDELLLISYNLLMNIHSQIKEKQKIISKCLNSDSNTKLNKDKLYNDIEVEFLDLFERIHEILKFNLNNYI